MPISWRVTLPNGNSWGISYGVFKGDGCICIPIDQLKGMSRNDISLTVLELMDEARSAEAYDIASRVNSLYADVSAFDRAPTETLVEYELILDLNRHRDEHIRQAWEKVTSYLYMRHSMQRERAKEERAHPKPGFVYLLQAGPYYKIGVSAQVDERIKQLSTLPPFDLELLHTIYSVDMYDLEKDLHGLYADKRKNGEWFELEPSDVEYIKGL